MSNFSLSRISTDDAFILIWLHGRPASTLVHRLWARVAQMQKIQAPRDEETELFQEGA